MKDIEGISFWWTAADGRRNKETGGPTRAGRLRGTQFPSSRATRCQKSSSTYLCEERDECGKLLVLLRGLEEEDLEFSDEVPLLLQKLLSISSGIALDVRLKLQEVHCRIGSQRRDERRPM